MLSPQKWHLQVPKPPDENERFRGHVISLAEDHPEFRPVLLEMCRDDAVFFIDVFGWQYNPDNVGEEVGPFICYDYQQKALLETIHRLYTLRKDVCWPKSRKMGATWLALFKDDWLCLLHARKKTLTFSHTEAAVDRAGDPDSLFWKVAFIHEHLPDWISRGVTKRKLGFNYPATNSVNTGVASTTRSGVGGRATSIFSDETAKQTNAADIIGQTRDTGPRLFCSSHYGVGTEFYQLTKRPDLFQIPMHWTLHPVYSKGLYRSDPEAPNGYEILDKTYRFPSDYKFVTDGRPFGGPRPGIRTPWYDEEARERTARDLAIHIDMDVEGSGWQFYDAGVIRHLELEYCRDPEWEGEAVVDYDTGRLKDLTRRSGGSLRLWFNPRGDFEMPVGRYGGGSDISAGTGNTPSTLTLGNAALGQKIAEYGNSNLDPTKFAAVCYAILKLFVDMDGNHPLFAWEAAGANGEKFTQVFMGFGYRRVYYQETPSKFAGFRGQTEKPGWYPTTTARGELHQSYRTALEKRRFINPSAPALKQTLEFEEVGGTDVAHPGEIKSDNPREARHNHGDYVISDALCCKMLTILGGRVQLAPPPPQIVPLSLEWRRKRVEDADREAQVAWD